jgi:hypothetical protein
LDIEREAAAPQEASTLFGRLKLTDFLSVKSKTDRAGDSTQHPDGRQGRLWQDQRPEKLEPFYVCQQQKLHISQDFHKDRPWNSTATKQDKSREAFGHFEQCKTDHRDRF